MTQLTTTRVTARKATTPNIAADVSTNMSRRLAPSPSLYEVLGVPATADAEAIKQSFKNLAKQYHPDVNPDPGAAEQFRVINEAYQTLSDDAKRRLYDVRISVGSIPGFDDLKRAGSRAVPREQVVEYQRLKRQALELPKTSFRRLVFMLAIPTAFLVRCVPFRSRVIRLKFSCLFR
jgi:curved DNA-binding protein CbpA